MPGEGGGCARQGLGPYCPVTSKASQLGNLTITEEPELGEREMDFLEEGGQMLREEVIFPKAKSVTGP